MLYNIINTYLCTGLKKPFIRQLDVRMDYF